MLGIAPAIALAQPFPTQSSSIPQVYNQPFSTAGQPFPTTSQQYDASGQPERRLRPYRIDPTFSFRETWTNNVDLAPSGAHQSDWVTEITPGLRINGVGQHTSLSGSITVPMLVYANTGSENNKVYPRVHLVGDVSMLDNVFHIQGLVSVQEQFLTPFGAQPVDLVNATGNRYRTETYGVSPYIQGVTNAGIAYQLRNNNIWSFTRGTPVPALDSRYTQVFGAVSDTRQQLGWRLTGDFSNTAFEGQNNEIYLRLVRAEPVWTVSPQLRLSLSGGYEDNDYQLTSSRGAIYGGGLEWRPNNRTFATARWEHRFFGPSYLLAFRHLTPLSIWRVSVSRNITTYPQQLGTLPAGVPVDALLNDLFASRFTDPAQREDYVDQFINDRGLPSTLESPVVLYGDRILLQESARATAGLIGARNTITFTIYSVHSEPIAGSGTALPPVLSAADNNTQTGGTVAWTYRLTPTLNLTTTFNGSRTEANAPFNGRTNQGSVHSIISAPISPHTTVFGGARYQALSSNVTPDYYEAAIFVGFRYIYR